MGQQRKAESTSIVAAWVCGRAFRTMSQTSRNVPQSHGKSSELISALTDWCNGSFRGKDRSCIIRRSPGVSDFGTVPSGEERNGPMMDSRRDREKGPE